MRRFLLQLALFWLLQALIFTGLHRSALRHNDNFIAASQDKEKRLTTLPGPRVVLVGGSNLAFGIDSTLIERWTGRPCVNMGLYAGLGLEFMLNEARAGLHRGDVVVISLEHWAFSSLPMTNGEVMDWKIMRLVNPAALRYAPQAARRCPLAIFLDGFNELGQIVQPILDDADGLNELGQVARTGLSPTVTMVPSIYARHSFNESGDIGVVRERTAGMAPIPATVVQIDPVACARSMALLEQFVADCRRHDIAVYLAMPPIPRSSYKQQASTLSLIETLLRQSVSAPLIVSSAEASRPDGEFFDTDYHLTTAGARERSEILGRRLAEVLVHRGQEPTPGPIAARPDRRPARWAR